MKRRCPLDVLRFIRRRNSKLSLTTAGTDPNSPAEVWYAHSLFLVQLRRDTRIPPAATGAHIRTGCDDFARQHLHLAFAHRRGRSVTPLCWPSHRSQPPARCGSTSCIWPERALRGVCGRRGPGRPPRRGRNVAPVWANSGHFWRIGLADERAGFRAVGGAQTKKSAEGVGPGASGKRA